MKCVQHEWVDVTRVIDLTYSRRHWVCSTCGVQQQTGNWYTAENKTETEGENRCFAPTLAEKPTS